MNVAIRVDASSTIGSGHVIRCKTLADELRRRGASVRFVCREHPGHLIALLSNAGYSVGVLPAGDGGQSADADATASALNGFAPNWLVVDHYNLDEEWESRLRDQTGRMFVIDDLANRRHLCDALLDQNWFGAETEGRYDGFVPTHCRLLLGPRYALLHPLFAQLRRSLPPRDGIMRRLLVFFGAVDSCNQTALVLSALQAPEFDDIAVDVVIGAANQHAAEIDAMVLRRGGAVAHRDLPNLAGLMARADVMAGAGGATTWERCCLSLPAVVAVTADNQEGFTVEVAGSGAQYSLGRADTLTADDWTIALRDFQRSPERVRACAAAARVITDGLGVDRVASVLSAPAGRPRLRNARRGDDAAESVAALLLVAEDPYGAPVGQVRVAMREHDALVDISIDMAPGDDGMRAALLRQMMEMVRRGQGAPRDWRDIAFLRSSGQTAAHCGGGESLRLTVLSDRTSWLNDHAERLLFQWFTDGHAVRWVHDPDDLVAGDACFLLGCEAILTPGHLRRHRHTLVVHESDLPRGRGWSPVTWQVLEGASRIPVTLFEATPDVDAGPIYLQTWITLDGTEILDELRVRQADATIALCREWVSRYPSITRDAVPQSGQATTYPRRTAAHSELDPNKPLREQFALLRVVDNERYPAFFSLGGERYVISIRKEKAAR